MRQWWATRAALQAKADAARAWAEHVDTIARTLHAHHVQYWRHGGRTDLANLGLIQPPGSEARMQARMLA